METSLQGFAPSHLSAASNPSTGDQKGFDLRFRTPSPPFSPTKPSRPHPALTTKPRTPVHLRCLLSPATSNHKAEKKKITKKKTQTKPKTTQEKICSLAGNIKPRWLHLTGKRDTGSW